MQIRRDEQFEDWLLQRLFQRLGSGQEQRTKEIHVSDLIWCQRKPILRSLLPAGQLTRRDAITFVVGRNQHDALQSIQEVSKEVRIESDGIVGNMDLVGTFGIAEIKGTRASLRKMEQFGIESEAGYYVEQLRCYSAMCWNKDPKEVYTHTKLIVFFINGSYGKEMSPDFRVWDVTFTPDELTGWYKEIVHRAGEIRTYKETLVHLKDNSAAIQEAIQNELLPKGPMWGSWECGMCTFKPLCYPNLPIESGTEKKLKTKG